MAADSKETKDAQTDRAKFDVVTFWIPKRRRVACHLSVLAMMTLGLSWFEPVTDLLQLTGKTSVSREELRARLRQMTDNELRRFGRDVQNMCSPEKNRAKPPEEESVIQLEEARTELKRRFEQRPKKP